MTKYGLFSKSQNESNSYYNVVSMPTAEQAEAYFAGRKQLSLEQFRSLFVVKEISENQKTLLYGNK